MNRKTRKLAVAFALPACLIVAASAYANAGVRSVDMNGVKHAVKADGSLKPNAVGHLQLKSHIVSCEKLTFDLRNALCKGAFAAASTNAGKDGQKGVDGKAGAPGADGKPGADGAKGDTGPAQLASQRFCVPTVCIDDAPGDTGSNGAGGFGWDNASNGPVKSLTVGTAANLTVTALTDGSSSTGSITLTWNGDDFTGPTGASDPSAVCTASGNGDSLNSLSCTYTDFSHTDKSDSFTFTPKRVSPAAVVSATAEVNGEVASATFPVKVAA